MHFILASNERHVVNVESDDRRHLILQVSEAVKNNSKYFSALELEMRNAGPEALLYELKNTDLSHFNVFAVPKTEALLSQKLKSLTGTIAWLYNCLSMAEIIGREWTEQGAEVPRHYAHQDYTANHRQYGDLRTSMSKSEFGAELKKFFGAELKDKRRNSQETHNRDTTHYGGDDA